MLPIYLYFLQEKYRHNFGFWEAYSRCTDLEFFLNILLDLFFALKPVVLGYIFLQINNMKNKQQILIFIWFYKYKNQCFIDIMKVDDIKVIEQI